MSSDEKTVYETGDFRVEVYEEDNNNNSSGVYKLHA